MQGVNNRLCPTCGASLEYLGPHGGILADGLGGHTLRDVHAHPICKKVPQRQIWMALLRPAGVKLFGRQERR